MGNKDADLIKRELGTFIARAVARGHGKRVIEDIAGQIETFGRYGFNKSHSVAYSVIAYQTAWLKAHYPAEFMAALLSSEIGNTDKVVEYINAAREMGLQVLPPSVNESGWKFTVIGDKTMRFGLGAVRNAGKGAVDSIIAARTDKPYTSLADLCDRIDLRLCNKRVLESLIGAGALDQLDGHRAQLFAALDNALREAQLLQQERDAGQVSLFGDAGGAEGGPAPRSPLPDIPVWSEHERLSREKEAIGFFISGHPLDRFREEVGLFGTRTTATLGEWTEHKVTVGAVVTAVKRQISRKSGAEYARLTLEDFHGTAEAIVFPDAWSRLSGAIRPDSVLLLTGTYSARDRDEERAPFIVEDAVPLAELRTTGGMGILLSWRLGSGPDRETARAVAALCTAHPGPAPVKVEWGDGNGTTVRLKARRLRVELTEELVDALRSMLGPERVRFENTR
ncbi:MAG: OB-fold nucleic acid binding domain-containing protein [Gemmatimonadales bacterium]